MRAPRGGIEQCTELLGVVVAEHEVQGDPERSQARIGKLEPFGEPLAHEAEEQLVEAAVRFHRLELARVGTHFAAWASDVDDPDRERAAAMAKGYAAEAAVFVTAEDIQIHGGVGFTWDCDAHWYYKRAKQNDIMLGYQGWQRRRLADLVLEPA